MTQCTVSDVYPKQISDTINQQYYAKIPQGSSFRAMIHSKNFLTTSDTNIALYSDHGFIHATDVAEQTPVILKTINGVLIPKRTNKNLEFMQNCGIVLGLIHDIGMSDVSKFGREMHGEFVAQEVFSKNFQPIFKAMWEKNIGNIPWLLLSMYHRGEIQVAPEIVFREILSLAVCHRKVLVPVELLNNPKKLQQRMRFFIAHSLPYQYQLKTSKSKNIKISWQNTQLQKQLKKFYRDFNTESFAWLLSTNKKTKELVIDIIDTLRALRCSDALRQRGTTLKTSAQFQVFVDQFTAKAIFALASGSRKMYFLELNDPISSAESNIANICLCKEGNLRFEFHRGFFHTKDATLRGVANLTKVVAQLDYDVFDTFVRNASPDFLPKARPKILLENTDDNPDFVKKLQKKLISIKPSLRNYIEIVPSLKNIPQLEYEKYINSENIDWSNSVKKAFLKKVSAHGSKLKAIDIKRAFKHARIVKINATDTLFEAKSFSGIAYFPFSSGLIGYPIGSYSPFNVAAFTPLGSTGIIRGDVRNATIMAKKPVKLLAIPKEDYLQYWHSTYSKKEFIKLIQKGIQF
ncbi:MAG: hypothetical protein M1561_07615 [Gammaproteobacteria bacterium]|nr:hypothetical protein [Gammaproteobacteria bacterium]